MPFRRRGHSTVRGVESEHAINAFARGVDVGALSADQFVQLIETLHMLGRMGAGVELSSLSTEVLADIVRSASKEQLKAITEHDELRSVFLDEIFRRMSEHFVPERARNVSFVVGWRFTWGDGSAGFDRFQTLIEDGVCVSSADLGHEPDTTITVSAEDFIRMATGGVAMATMFVTGRVRVKGEYAPAMRLSSYFDLPGGD
ncbi:SCP2 sterol-binding domain-containing protein [Amycolatopsis cihanbeyliensis]|uniref:SCP-2 sterol transfer family protein n=1 Tax=Amycolatopsis cihanbeyliensis TaxID=1128664 RepID=A0A542DKW2_AMYCI|nr:SCP2 sterol-binding domain-containing protein [Amycolatopsis cihanbeyliensis]TQJ03737.1 SCP-2 sterol transfer family protein [Amycolatopsis cihanbeyliensis]